MKEFFFGKLTLDAIPHVWYTIGGTVFIIMMVIAIAMYLTKTKRWGWLWNEWLTSTDPKKIGTMYMIFASLMFFRGMLDAGMVWLQQSIAADSQGYLTADHFQQIFTSHGDIMVFFVTMGFFFGLMNWIVPLQIGARDLAFPFLNSLGLWLTIAGGLLINFFFIIGGDFANTGWLAIAPFSELEFNPSVGVDYLIWSLQLSGLGSLLAGINFLVTIIKKRAPGMTLMKMPLFTWNSLCAMVLIISAFPVLTATTLLLWLDRAFGMHFFTTGYRRKSNDVLESHMDVGPSGGLYFGYTGLWNVLRNCLYIFAKENFWICLHGMGGNYNHRPFLFGLAAPLFCHGRRPRCELFFWHCDHADCDTCRCSSI